MPKPVQNFKDEVYTIINYGKVAHPVVGAVPAWNTYEGEMAFFHNTAASPSERIYVRLASAWVLFAAVFDTTGSGGLPDPPVNSVQFNSGGQFGGDAAFLFNASNRHASLGSTAFLDYDIIAGSSSQAIFNIQDRADSTGTTYAGFRVGVALSGNTGTLRAADIYLQGTARNTSADAEGLRVYARATTGSFGNLAALRVVADYDYTTLPAAGLNHYGAYLTFDAGGVKANLANSNVKALIRMDDADGSVRGTNYDFQALSLSAFNADENAITVRPIFNFFSGSAHRTKSGYRESLNQFEGPVLIDGGFTAAEATLDIGNANTQIFLAGSGAITVSTASVLITGSQTVFGAEVDAGHVLRMVSGGSTERFYGVVQGRSNNTELYLSEVPTVSIGSGTFRIIKPHIRVSPAPAAQDNDAIEPFTLCANGYLGIRLTAPSAPLDVNGNARIRGNLTVNGINVVTGTSSKASGVIFTTTATGIAQNTTAETTLITGAIGTTALAANTFSEGRAIRLTAWGYYNTAIVPDALTMRVKLGGVTLLSTGAQTPAGTVSSGGWALNANIICRTTGGAGTAFSQGDFPHFTGVTYANWPMVTTTAVTLNTTANNVLEVTAQWGGASAASELFMSNCVAELLN